MFTPVLDRVLLRRIPDSIDPDSKIVKPDLYTEKPLKGEVLALGTLVVIGGRDFPLEDFVNVGDTVRFSEYNAEEIEVDGELLVLVRLQDIKGIYRE